MSQSTPIANQYFLYFLSVYHSQDKNIFPTQVDIFMYVLLFLTYLENKTIKLRDIAISSKSTPSYSTN